MHVGRSVIFSLVVVGLMCPALAQAPEPQHSRISVPVRPERTDPAFAEPSKAQLVIPGVPAYVWRHGCAPTALGMVVGYWDGQGFDLVAGEASSQTDAVQQVIASGGHFVYANPPQDLPWAPGNEHHYEDYARPVELALPIQPDAYITAGRAPHADDCLADYIGTSRSLDGLAYGWSWNYGIKPAFEGYVAAKSAFYEATCVEYYFDYQPTFSFNVLKNEIDNDRPMVLLVDSDGDGETDHFVTAVGYDDSIPSSPKYLFYDTWDRNVHTAVFRGTSSSYDWGIWGGWSFNIVDNESTEPLTFAAPLPSGGLYQTGDSLEWTVATLGASGSVSYQWQYGVTQEEMADLDGETFATLSLGPLVLGDTGWYRCRAQDDAARVTYTPAVYVHVADQVPLGGLTVLLGSGTLLAGFAFNRIRRSS